MARLTISNRDFLLGASDTDYSLDGGFSPVGKGHNIRKTEGLLAPPPTPEETDDLQANETGIIAIGGTSSDTLLVVSNATNDLATYEIASDGSLSVAADADSGRNYTKALSDAISYDNILYVTSTTDIARGSQGSLDVDWWTTTADGGQAALDADPALPHYLMKFEDTLYISDNNTIKTWDGTNAATALTLPSDIGITSYVEYNNRFYIATINQNELVSAKNGAKIEVDRKMYVWDGINTNSKFDSIIPLPDRVYSMVVFQGQLFVFFEDHMALWNGVKFQKVRDLSSIVYKSDMVVRQDKLYIKEGGNILAFDGKRFWYQLSTGLVVDTIWNLYGDDLGYTAVQKSYKADLDDADANGIWYSKWYEFADNVKITRVIVEMAEAMAENDVNTLTLANEAETTKNIVVSYAVSGAKRVFDTKNQTASMIDFDCSSLQVRLNTFDNLIKKITIEYVKNQEPIK